MPKIVTKETFLENAKKIHGNLYSYKKVSFVNMKTPVTIICKIHGDFFANTQEKKFYMLKGLGDIKLNIAKTYNNEDDRIYVIGIDQKNINIVPQTTITASVVLTDYKDFWNTIKITILESDGGLYHKTLAQLTKNAALPNIVLNNANADPYASIS